MGLKAFGYLDKEDGYDSVPVVLRVGTDNRANESLISKASTTKWPLALVNMQVAEHLLKNNLLLDLRWRPRDENTLADDLTNKKFGKFDADRRVEGLVWTMLALTSYGSCGKNVATSWTGRHGR